jgi:YVTN family beta-propeller protein
MAVDERTDRVFVPLCDAKAVGILDAATGRVIRSVRVVSGPTAVAVDERVGHAFVTSDGVTDSTGQPIGVGTLSLLDARTGAVLRTVAVGSQPDTPAVDEMTGRVFVANYDSGTVSVVDATSGRVRATVAVGNVIGTRAT